MVFCNVNQLKRHIIINNVTILILIDGFLQYQMLVDINKFATCHNHYFNRWFSAIHCSLNDIDTQKMSQSLF